MPHLVQMDKKHGDEGLVVIGDECQGSDIKAIEGVTKKAKAEFPITQGTTRPPGMRGIPHAVIFDTSGKMVFSGHPMDSKFDKIVKDALKEVEEEEAEQPSGPVIAERNWTNSAGKTMRAAVLRVEGESVVFKIGYREVFYPLENLSDDDQETIKEAWEEALS